jgi:hypothetical protein
MQNRKLIFWRLIPVLMTILLLSNTIGPLWTAILLSEPLLPFVFIVVFIAIGSLVFMTWWRNQKSYFAS